MDLLLDLKRLRATDNSWTENHRRNITSGGLTALSNAPDLQAYIWKIRGEPWQKDQRNDLREEADQIKSILGQLQISRTQLSNASAGVPELQLFRQTGLPAIDRQIRIIDDINGWYQEFMTRDAGEAFTGELITMLDNAPALFLDARLRRASAVSGLRSLASGNPDAPQPNFTEPTPTSMSLRSTAAADFYNAGVLLAQAGNLEDAISKYDEAIQLYPDHIEALHNRGAAYDELGFFKLALQDLDGVLEIYDQNSLAYAGRGLIYSHLGQHEVAVQDFDEAIRLDPEFAEAYSDRGFSYLSLGRYEQGIKDFDKAIHLNPGLSEAFAYRAVGDTFLGKDSRVQQDIERARELGYDAVLLETTIEQIKQSRPVK